MPACSPAFFCRYVSDAAGQRTFAGVFNFMNTFGEPVCSAWVTSLHLRDLSPTFQRLRENILSFGGEV